MYSNIYLRNSEFMVDCMLLFENWRFLHPKWNPESEKALNISNVSIFLEFFFFFFFFFKPLLIPAPFF